MGDLLRQGNIFTSVCHSVHGVCVSQHALGQTTPLGRHLSLADTPGGHPSHLGRQPPRHILPPGQIPSRADIPQADTPPPGQTPPSRPPWTHIPFPVHAGIHTPCPLHAGIHIPSPAQCMLGIHTSPYQVHIGIHLPVATAADGTHPTGMLSCLQLSSAVDPLI